MTATKIQQLWSRFIEAEQSSYEKSVWLDIFLAEFLAQIKEGCEPSDITAQCSSNGGMSTLIACELLSEVHSLCLPPGEDLRPLVRLLVSGWGWRAIAALHHLGCSDVPCGEELASLLSSLFLVGLESTSKGETICEEQNPYVKLYERKQTLDDLPILKAKLRSLSDCVHHLNRSISNTAASDSSSESEVEGEVASIRIRLDPMDFDYFTSVVRSDDETGIVGKQISPSLPQPEFYKDERVKQVLKTSLSGYEFTLLILDLLQQLTTQSKTCLQSVNLALQKLCCLQFGSSSLNVEFASSREWELKSRLVELMLSGLTGALGHLDAAIRTGLLPLMIKVLEDAVYKIASAIRMSEEVDDLTEEDEHLSVCSTSSMIRPLRAQEANQVQNVLYGTTLGISVFLRCMLNQRCSSDKLKEYLEMYELFSQSHNGRLLETSVSVILSMPFVDCTLSAIRVRRLVEHVGMLVSSLKRVRTELAQSQNKRRRMQPMSIPSYHHHVDIGTPYCHVAAQFGVLVRLLNMSILRTKVLRTMMQCGTCCCYSPQVLLAALVETLRQTGSSRIRCLVFTVLERTFYHELGAVAPIQHNDIMSCSTCIQVFQTHPDENILNRWSCVNLLRQLLDPPDAQLSHMLTSHLLRIAPRFTSSVRQELLTQVFLPTFLSAKKCYLDQYEDINRLVVVSCLSSMVALLSCSPALVEEFFSHSGLEHLSQLITLAPFVRPCCCLLEIAATVDIWKLYIDMKENKSGEEEIVKEVEQLPALVLLQRTTCECTDELMTALVERKFTDKDFETKLTISGTFWRSTANLAIYSSLYRKSIVSSKDKNLQFLMVLMDFLMISGEHWKCPPFVRLLEAVFVVNLLCYSYVSSQAAVVAALQTQIFNAMPIPSAKVRLLCEVFIKCASIQGCNLQIMAPYRNQKISPGWDEIVSEDECDIYESGGEDASSSYVTADEGYEADVEFPPPGISGCASNGSAELNKQQFIVHPELCSLAINIIVQLPMQQQYTQESVNVLQQLVSMCRENSVNCRVLAKAGMISQLLGGMKLILGQRNSKLTEFQKIVLELVMLISKQSIEPHELAQYLSFFKDDDPPLDLLLSPLVTLGSSSSPQPNYILCFPVERENIVIEGITGSASNLVKTMSQQHKNLNLETCWSASALAIPLNADLGWSMWLHGFSISFWLLLDKGNSTGFQSSSQHLLNTKFPPDARKQQTEISSLLHIVSVGYEGLVLEIWCETSAGSLVVQLTRPDAKGIDVIEQTSVNNCIPLGHWHHVAINVRDFMEKRKNVIKINIFVDGWYEESLSLTFTGLLVRKAHSSVLLLGHTSAQPFLAGSLLLANLQIFRCPVFTKERAIYLLGLGPAQSSLTDCPIGKTAPNFTLVFNSKTLSAGIDWDSILESKETNLKELQENLLLTFSAQNFKVVNVYPQVVTNAGGPLFPSQPGFRVVTAEQRASQQLPLSLSPVLLTSKLNVQQYKGLVAAATLLGGTSVFLFLFARVVELKSTQEDQSQALFLLLKLIQSDCGLFSQFVSQECHKLILKVLQSPVCYAGQHVLKAVLDACCDKPVLQYHVGQKQFHVIGQTDAIVVNSFVLRTIAGAWNAWDPAGALGPLFQALHALLRDDHRFREFNAAQMNRVGMVDALLIFCKEKLLQEQSGKLEASVCCSLVELIRSLMGAPPEFSHIVAVADFLLLSHPACNTYISHARSNMYFLLDVNSGLPTLEWTRKSNSGTHFTSSTIDPLKLNKALANLQIQQGLDSNRVGDEYQKPEDIHRKTSIACNALLAQAEEAVNFFPGMSSNEISYEESEKFTVEVQENLDKMGSQGLIVEGLLFLLRDVMLVLPDNMAHQVLNHVVRADALLIMANHPDARVRTAVIRALTAYIQRSSDEGINRLLKIHGFHLLACQLASFPGPASRDLVEATVALGTRCPLPLEDQAEVGAPVTGLQIAALPPLLSLLPKTLSDTGLAHILLVYLHHLVIKMLQYQPLQIVLELGLLEVLCRMMDFAGNLPFDHQDTAYSVSSRDIILGDLHIFFTSLVGHAILSPGPNKTQVLTDALQQLGFVGERGSQTVRICCRDAQILLLESTFDSLVDRLGLLKCHISVSTSTLHSSFDDKTSMSSSSSGSGISIIPVRKEANRGDIAERFRTVILKSVELLTNTECGQPVSSTEQGFQRKLVSSLLPMLLDRSGAWTVRETIRSQCSQLLCWLLAPWQPTRTRTFIVNLLLRQEGSRCRELMTTIINTHVQVEHKLTVYLWDLLKNHNSASDVRSCEDLISRMVQWGLLAPSHSMDQWDGEVALLKEEAQRLRESWIHHNDMATNRSVYKLENLAKLVTDSAMQITRSVVEAQNIERKVFMEHIKAHYSEDVRVRSKWQRLCQQLTHERAVWCFPKSYPQSWQLDPTEGPCRIRKRLQRCHLGIGRRYLLPNEQAKADETSVSQPLAYLFEQNQSSMSTVMIERLHTNEKIQHMSTARVVTPAREIPGEVLIGESCLYFVPDSDISSLARMSGDFDISSTAWQYEDVKEIHNRRYQLQERALEIFLLNGKTYFVAFQSSKERDKFSQELSQCRLPNRIPTDNLSDAVQLWREGLLTNWEYLSQLNKMAGRSYNDLMQYPVMPFILADYTSEILDLSIPQCFRNFKRPMAVQEKKNEQHYINNYNYLKQELQSGTRHITLNQEPYHYGSHYSNSGTILHFLVRLPPFTRMFLNYQDNNFDLPDRTFHSMHTTWRLTSADSTTDVKELVPEFFYLPEFLLNNEGFNFGVRQSGHRVHHVQLPPWSGGDSRRFILLHRQALESDFVRENLPHWIDLVFGYKQTGKSAVDAVNVFHPATYYGFDIERIRDPLERAAWETMVRTYGQTPRQLFRSAHPMVVQALSSKPVSPQVFQPCEAMPCVRGFMWGSYVGSPGEAEPAVVWHHHYRAPVGNLVPLITNDVYGLAPQTSLLLCYSKEKGLGVVGGTSIRSAAIISWRHSDGVVRAKLKKEQPPWPVVFSDGLDPICACVTSPDVAQIWLGYCSGRIQVLQYKLETSLDFSPEAVTLLGHSQTIQCICLCRNFSIAVSCGQDGSAIIWDLNGLSYVRSIPVGSPIYYAAISDTLGDIALVTESELSLFSINATLIGKVIPSSTVTAVCFSTAPEGLSVNVIATGHMDGVIRVWSSWNLATLREIHCNLLIQQPVLSLTYSHDAQHLYASSANGLVVVWEGSNTKSTSRSPKFLNLTTFD